MKLATSKQSSLGQAFKSKFVGGVLVAAMLAGGLAADVAPVRAADPVMKIGVLDEVKLGEGYTKYRNEMEELDRTAKAVQNQVGARRFLNAAEGTRFDILSKKVRSAPEETDFVALIKTGNDRILNYNTWSGQATLTEEQKKGFKEMQDFQKANAKIADDMEDTAFRALRTQQEATDKKYIDNANAMVQKVASDQKLTVLLRKDAIVWSTPTVDITDEVLKRLNLQ